jgi:hypothetical protein
MPTDYYSVLSRAVSRLQTNTRAERDALYDRARLILKQKLDSVSTFENYETEQQALEEAIRRLERERSDVLPDRAVNASITLSTRAMIAFALLAIIGGGIGVALIFPSSLRTSFFKSTLIREQAEKLIYSSEPIQQLTHVLPLQTSALMKGDQEGLWTWTPGSSMVIPKKNIDPSVVEIGSSGILLNKPVPLSLTVTGISDVPTASNMKEAIFTWEYREIPRILKRLCSRGGSGTATLRLFDDGWRIESVRAEASPEGIPLSESEKAEEAADLQAEQDRRQKIQERLEERIAQSKKPTKVLLNFQFPMQGFPGVHFLTLTDVDIQFNSLDLNKHTVWFGDIVKIQEGMGSTIAVSVNGAHDIQGATPAAPNVFVWTLGTDQYVTDIGLQRKTAFVNAAISALNEWRLHNSDLPQDAFR